MDIGPIGSLASVVMKTNPQQRLFMDLAVGMLGGFMIGFLFNQFGTVGITIFNKWSIVVAFAGAMVLFAVIRLLVRPQFLRMSQFLPVQNNKGQSQ